MEGNWAITLAQVIHKTYAAVVRQPYVEVNMIPKIEAI